MGRQSPGFKAALEAAMDALRGETKVLDDQGNQTDWTILGAIRSSESIVVRDEYGLPLWRITVEASKYLPPELHRQTLPVLSKWSPDRDLLRLSVRFDDPSMPFTNQPVSSADKGAFSKTAQEVKDTLLKILG